MSEWQPISEGQWTDEGVYDLWVKCWDCTTDKFKYRRVTDSRVKDVPGGWFVTHWRHLPKPPQ